MKTGTNGNSPLESRRHNVSFCRNQRFQWLSKTKTGRNFAHHKLPKNKHLKEKAKALRKAGILSEVLFWKAFKHKELLLGYDIDRQVIIGNYIADFFIPELGLVFEIDGVSHDFKGEHDTKREEFLLSLKLMVIHFSDREVRKKIDEVGEIVLAAIKLRKVEIESWVGSTPTLRATPQEGN